MPRIQVFAGQPIEHSEDVREPSVRNHGYIALRDVRDALFSVGLEYKTADYFPNRQVVIVIDPDPFLPEDVSALRARLTDAEAKLRTVRTLAESFPES